MLKRLLKEPMVQFSGVALLIFGLYQAFSPSTSQPAQGSILVSGPKIEQIGTVFIKTWQRPPSAEELKALIDDYVTEEVYVREAVALGLDQDDTVIRRRLRQKMEFMSEASAEATAPTELELQAYLDEHPGDFALEGQIAFQQVFLNPERRGDTLQKDTESLLVTLRDDPAADPAMLGDASMLPPLMDLASLREIEQIFGPGFVDDLRAMEPGTWNGPVESAYGVHLVKVLGREPGKIPQLADVRETVVREWTNAKRNQLEADRLADLLAKYDITIEMPLADDSTAAGTKP
jgi:hypothetical protein